MCLATVKEDPKSSLRLPMRGDGIGGPGYLLSSAINALGLFFSLKNEGQALEEHQAGLWLRPGRRRGQLLHSSPAPSWSPVNCECSVHIIRLVPVSSSAPLFANPLLCRQPRARELSLGLYLTALFILTNTSPKRGPAAFSLSWGLGCNSKSQEVPAQT